MPMVCPICSARATSIAHERGASTLTYVCGAAFKVDEASRSSILAIPCPRGESAQLNPPP
jgi:hypothetical protein